MKKFLCTLASAALLGVGGIAFAGVVGSVHDLTTATGGAFSTTGNTDEVCVFCHTPHAGSNNGAPLWNRQASAAGYTMYDSSFSSTIDMTVAGSPQGVSAACLSCHDGTIAFDVLINATTAASGTYNYTAGGADQGWTFTGADSMSGRGLPTEFGADLTNQHPISVTYDPAQDPAFNPAAAVTGAGGLVLYGATANQVECGTCHNPHDTTNVPFLRKSNAASALCTTCHIK
jgi:predicted CXXCH cytochrome family protein